MATITIKNKELREKVSEILGKISELEDLSSCLRGYDAYGEEPDVIEELGLLADAIETLNGESPDLEY